MSFLQGDSGKASGLLIRASEEAKALKPNPALAARFAQQWRAVKFEVLQPKVSSWSEVVLFELACALQGQKWRNGLGSQSRWCWACVHFVVHFTVVVEELCETRQTCDFLCLTAAII